MEVDDRAAKRARFSALKSTAEQSMSRSLAPSPPSPAEAEDASVLAPCSIRLSLVYKMQLKELRAILKDEEEKLQHTKHSNDSQNRELQILLLRTDIEKLALVLRSQLAREEAADVQSGAVDPALTRSSTLTGINGISGPLPRLSTFMLKQAKTLQLELRSLEAQLEYMSTQACDEEEVTAKLKRIKDLRFFVGVFERQHNADREKEKAAMHEWEAKFGGRPRAQPEGSGASAGAQRGPRRPRLPRVAPYQSAATQKRTGLTMPDVGGKQK